MHTKRRRAIGASFNSDFLKRLHSFLLVEIKVLMTVLDRAAESGEVVDFDAIMSDFAVDVISRTAFGHAFGSQLDRSNKMAKLMTDCLEAVDR